MPEPATDAKPASKAIAEGLERERPAAVVSRIAKLRAGRVLLDWSQNTEHGDLFEPLAEPPPETG
jgi:DNA primase